MKKHVMVGVVLGLVSCASFADGFYVAADVAQINWDVEDASATKTALGVAGGYKFSIAFKDTVAIELGYRQLGTVKDGDSYYSYRTEINSSQLSVISTHQFTPQLSAYGRLGVARLDVDWRVSYGNGSDSISKAVNRAVFGVGGRYTFDEHLATRLEYTYIKWDEFDFSGPALGVEYSF